MSFQRDNEVYYLVITRKRTVEDGIQKQIGPNTLPYLGQSVELLSISSSCHVMTRATY